MRLKSFYGANLTEAMSLVRETLGDNAIIVATRDDENGGVRVTAAIDEAPRPVKTATTVAAASVAHAECTGSEVIEVIATSLLKHQVPTNLAEKLLASATQFANDDPVLALSAAFETHLNFVAPTEEQSSKPLMFVGIPGAGKTLCTAKMATKATLAKRKTTVISTDIERAGGMEQLAIFTRLLKLNLIEIEDPHALRDAVAMQAGDFVLIDTAGKNPFQPSERQALQEMITSGGGEAVFVLPSDLDALEAIDLATEFRKIGANRLLFTRLDMTRRLGTIMRVAFETKMALTYFSASPKVTEAPTLFNPVTLARLVLPPQYSVQAMANGTR